MNLVIHYLKTAIFCLFRPSAFVTVARDWKGMGALYLLIVFATVYLPLSLYFGVRMNTVLNHPETDGFSDMLEAVLVQVPTITIADGQIDAGDVPMPYRIIAPGYETPVVVIDTRDVPTPPTDNTPIYLTRHQLLLAYQGHPYPISVPDLLSRMQHDSAEPLVIDEPLLREGMLAVRDSIPSLTFVAYVGEISGRMLEQLIWSLIMTFAFLTMLSFMRLRLNFTTAMRVTVVAGTAVIALKLLTVIFAQQIFAYPQTVYLLVHLLYLYLAAEAIKKAAIKLQ